MTKILHFIMAGFKMGDVDAVVPISKKPLCMDGLYNNIQSQNHVFPVQIMVANETKEGYEAFKEFFDFFAMAGDKTINRDGSPCYWAALDEFNDLDVTATMDMSAQWKGLHKGSP
jgi:hypothetical protein